MGKKYGDSIYSLIDLFNTHIKKYRDKDNYIVDENGKPLSSEKMISLIKKECEKDLIMLGCTKLSTNFIDRYKLSLHIFYDVKNRKWKYSTSGKNDIVRNTSINFKDHISNLYSATVFVLHLYPQGNGSYNARKVVSNLAIALELKPWEYDYQLLKNGRLILYIDSSTRISKSKIKELLK